MPWISLEVEEDFFKEINRAVKAVPDIDRSKFIRAAIRNYLHAYRVVSISTLPRPEGATEIPVVEVLENEEEE